ncbi:TPA: hypothetical protein ACS72K_001084 [Providencia alcalifaciens]
MNQQNNSDLNSLIKKHNAIESEIRVSRNDHRIAEERLVSEFTVKNRADFASDSEYDKFRDSQNKLFDDCHQSRKKMEEAEAKMKELNESIRKIGRDDKPTKQAEQVEQVEQAIQAHIGEELESDSGFDLSKFAHSKYTINKYNIDATLNRIAENSARMNKEISVSDHVKSAENMNSYYQTLFGVPVHITGF